MWQKNREDFYAFLNKFEITKTQ
jgi:hypothetical protein